MASRVPSRLAILALGLLKSSKRRPYIASHSYRRILVAHHLLLGDTLLLTPMLAKLRNRYPEAEIWMTVAPPFSSLYDQRPYGVKVLPFSPTDLNSLRSWLNVGGFDVAFVPGDPRYAWLARALGAECIVALAQARKSWKTWQVDHHVKWPETPTTVSDIFCSLIDGPPAPPFVTAQWPLPLLDIPHLPTPYCVLHVSARNPLRRWPPSRWNQLASQLRQRRYHVIWSCAPGEASLFDSINIDSSDTCISGTLDLPRLRQLIGAANLLITVETGIAHLCRTTGTPSVVIFGQGNPQLHGNESFWSKESSMHPMYADISCRNQHHLFGQILPWVHRCDRQRDECPSKGECIAMISVDSVLASVDSLAYPNK